MRVDAHAIVKRPVHRRFGGAGSRRFGARDARVARCGRGRCDVCKGALSVLVVSANAEVIFFASTQACAGVAGDIFADRADLREGLVVGAALDLVSRFANGIVRPVERYRSGRGD